MRKRKDPKPAYLSRALTVPGEPTNAERWHHYDQQMREVEGLRDAPATPPELKQLARKLKRRSTFTEMALMADERNDHLLPDY